MKKNANGFEYAYVGEKENGYKFHVWGEHTISLYVDFVKGVSYAYWEGDDFISRNGEPMEGELKAMFETLKREPEYAWIFDKYERLKNAPVMHHVGDCDGGYRFMVFPKSSTDDYIYEVLKLYGITWDDFFPQSHYAHAGAYYTEQAELIKKGGRILFKQFEGYNV